MLDTGLSKGVMHFAGLGPQQAWTLTTRKGEVHCIWELFSARLPNLQQAAFFIGSKHFLIKRSDHCLAQNQIEKEHIERFLAGESVVGTRLAQIAACMEAIARTLHNRKVRIFNYIDLFEIMSQDYHDELNSYEEGHTEMLYANKNGFCQIPHQRRVCRIGKEDQCIFVKIDHMPKGTYIKKRHYCGKFYQKFADRRLSSLASGKIHGAIGTCKNLCGFEI